jgi:hypothetical protein
MAARRRTALVLLGLTGSVVGGGYALAARGSSISARVRPATIYYRTPRPNATNVAGRVESGRRGAPVVLEIRRWPFHGSFRSVATERTARGGRFNFVQRPSRATEYRVASAAARSRIQTAYLYPGYENAVCTWSGSHGHGSCSHAPTKAGSYTMHFSFEFLYPAAVFSRESGLPVFVYFAECFGCSAPPATLARQGTVSQSQRRSGAAHVSISQRFTVKAGQRYRWDLAPCLQSTEQSNGFGLPGRPGSHHCGSASVPSRFFTRGRDLG